MRTLRKLNILGAIVALLSTTLLLSSCISDNDNEPYNPSSVTALVTYTGNRTSGAAEQSVTRSYFELLTTDGNIYSLYTTPETALKEDQFKSGQRMWISYQPTGNNPVLASGEVTLINSPIPVSTSDVITATTEEAKAANAPMYVVNINRTGNYLNLETRLTYYSDREFSILLDESTAGSDMPELYVTTVEKGTPQGITQNVFASFNITSIWRNPAISGIKVHINNTGSSRQVFEFMK